MPMTHGDLFAGIGGFSLGFERSGIETRWQVEIDPKLRAVLGDRFPGIPTFEDVCGCSARNLEPVDVITAGFPCQDLSIFGTSGKREGLAGKRSGLFFEVIRIVREIRPKWLVLENVVGMLHHSDGTTFQKIIKTIDECGYVGFWRVLNAKYFGVPQARRRVFMVAGLGRYPDLDFLADAIPVDNLPITIAKSEEPVEADRFASHTLTTRPTLPLGGEVLVAESDRWDQMVERERMSEIHGIPRGLDADNFKQRHAAGNAVVPAIAEWIGRILLKS